MGGLGWRSGGGTFVFRSQPEVEAEPEAHQKEEQLSQQQQTQQQPIPPLPGAECTSRNRPARLCTWSDAGGVAGARRLSGLAGLRWGILWKRFRPRGL
jgi:hypothetical protein